MNKEIKNYIKLYKKYLETEWVDEYAEWIYLEALDALWDTFTRDEKNLINLEIDKIEVNNDSK